MTTRARSSGVAVKSIRTRESSAPPPTTAAALVLTSSTLLDEILELAGPLAAVSCMGVCREWSKAARSERTWQRWVCDLWKHKVCVPAHSWDAAVNGNWREAYWTSLTDQSRTQLTSAELTGLTWNFRFLTDHMRLHALSSVQPPIFSQFSPDGFYTSSLEGAPSTKRPIRWQLLRCAQDGVSPTISPTISPTVSPSHTPSLSPSSQAPPHKEAAPHKEAPHASSSSTASNSKTPNPNTPASTASGTAGGRFAGASPTASTTEEGTLVRIGDYPPLALRRTRDWGWSMQNRFVEIRTPVEPPLLGAAVGVSAPALLARLRPTRVAASHAVGQSSPPP